MPRAGYSISGRPIYRIGSKQRSSEAVRASCVPVCGVRVQRSLYVARTCFLFFATAVCENCDSETSARSESATADLQTLTRSVIKSLTKSVYIVRIRELLEKAKCELTKRKVANHKKILLARCESRRLAGSLRWQWQKKRPRRVRSRSNICTPVDERFGAE